MSNATKGKGFLPALTGRGFRPKFPMKIELPQGASRETVVAALRAAGIAPTDELVDIALKAASQPAGREIRIDAELIDGKIDVAGRNHGPKRTIRRRQR